MDNFINLLTETTHRGTGSYYVALMGLELATESRLAVTLKIYFFLLLTARVKGMYQWLILIQSHTDGRLSCDVSFSDISSYHINKVF